MKNLIWALPLVFVVGCGDKDEDTGVEDTSEEVADDTGAES